MDYNRQNRTEGVAPIYKGFLSPAWAVSKFKPDLVHSHTYQWRTTMTLGLLRSWNRFRCVVTIHGESFFDGVKPWALPGLKRALKQFDAIIADNQLLKDWVVNEAGVDADRVRICHAFLPPTEEQQDPKWLPGHVAEFLEQHSPVILVNGAVATFRNQDKYGIRHAVLSAALLKKKYPRLGLIFVSTGVQHKKEMASLQDVIDQSGLGDDFLLAENLPELVPLISASDVLLRTTATDGDSLIVRESLLAQTPVVATDVVERPDGVVCFPYGDVDALSSQITAVLERQIKTTPENGANAHAGGAILDTYTRALQREK